MPKLIVPGWKLTASARERPRVIEAGPYTFAPLDFSGPWKMEVMLADGSWQDVGEVENPLDIYDRPRRFENGKGGYWLKM